MRVASLQLTPIFPVMFLTYAQSNFTLTN